MMGLLAWELRLWSADSRLSRRVKGISFMSSKLLSGGTE